MLMTASFGIGVLTWFMHDMLDLYNGYMLVVPNREVDIYSRLWCVYEIFVCKQTGLRVALANTLSSAGKVSSEHATCSSYEDQQRITKEIRAHATFAEVDMSVFMTTNGAWWMVLLASATVGSAVAVLDLASSRLDAPCNPTWLEHVFFHIIELRSGFHVRFYGFTLFFSKLTSWFSMFYLFAAHQGRPTASTVYLYTLKAVAAGCVVICIGIACLHFGWLDYTCAISVQLIGTTFGLYHAAIACLALWTRLSPRSLAFFGRLPVLVALIFGVVAPAITFWQASKQCTQLWYSIFITSCMTAFGSYGLLALMLWYGHNKWGLVIVDDSTTSVLDDKLSIGKEEAAWV
eukprot:TRINITY_DN17140_c0_g1_i1.p1 TRINITY_DN17140_c0_g1~~TRINITY_DN17140_c0_g1_i1.p1  ORF type:complete len:347 (-),score=22.53 TRINITY_DN17140_c0_g1_i1:567-1607(-)